MDNDRVKVVGIFVIIFLVLCGYFYFTQGRQNVQQAKLQKQQLQQLVDGNEVNSSTQQGSDQSDDVAASKKKKYVNPDLLYKVHVAGEVKKPGVYALDDKARVIDAIEIAGGVTDEADLDRVNLAEYIKDGEKIRVPSFKERLSSGESGFTGLSSDFDSKSNSLESIASSADTVKKGRYKFGDDAEDSDEDRVEKSTLININKASVDELKQLPGVGSTIANSIILYREENGDFDSIEDLKNVSRIGDKTFSKIKDFITVK